MPLVSVVVPNFNCGIYINKTIESIVEQTISDWELLICDDGSTDNSLSVIEEWIAKDKRIRLFINKKNEGHIYSYNRLFDLSSGDYIMIQDADDWSDKRRMEKQIEVIRNFDVKMCLSNSVFHQSYEREDFPARVDSGYIDIRTKEHWAPATLMFSRDILLRVKGFSDYFTHGTSMDRYFIMDILDNYRGYYVDEYLYHILVRPNSDHRSIDLRKMRKLILHDVYLELKNQRVEHGTDWLKEGNVERLAEYENSLLRNREYLSDKVRVFACIQIDHNRKKLAWKLLVKAFKLTPFRINNYRSLFYLIKK